MRGIQLEGRGDIGPGRPESYDPDPLREFRTWWGSSPYVEICGAKAKSTGEPCRRPPMQNGRCRYHGGPTPSGRAHHAFKHGRYSKYAPADLLEKARAIVEDPHLLSSRAEIAIVDIAMEAALQGMDVDMGIAAAAEFRPQLEEFEKALNHGDIGALRRSLDRLFELADQAHSVNMAMQTVMKFSDLRRKLVATEIHYVRQQRMAMPLVEAYTLIDTLTIIITEEVRDPDVLEAIRRRFERVLGSHGTRKTG